MVDRNPHSEMEVFVATVWSEVLKTDHIGLDDTFVDLGGDSLDALQVIAKIEKALGVRLKHEGHFVSTLEQVAADLDAAVAASAR